MPLLNRNIFGPSINRWLLSGGHGMYVLARHNHYVYNLEVSLRWYKKTLHNLSINKNTMTWYMGQYIIFYTPKATTKYSTEAISVIVKYQTLIPSKNNERSVHISNTQLHDCVYKTLNKKSISSPMV